MKGIDSRNRLFVLLCLALVVMYAISGCVPSAEIEKKQEPTFFPPPPALPRFQFLRSFNGSADFNKKASGLDAFIGVSGRRGFVLKKAYGVAMYQGSLYAVDTMNGVFQFDLIKKKFSPLQGAQGLGKLVLPIGIVIDSQGNKYVCDPVRNQVVKYDKKNFYVKSYSNPDTWKPVGLAVYEDKLFVVDGTHNKGRVQVFDVASGALVDSIGRSGPENEQLRIPVNIAFDSDGYLYVVDMGRFQVVKYDRDGHYRGFLGGAGSSFGKFGRPKGIAIDHNGLIYVVDAEFNHVQVLSSNGQSLTAFGQLPLDKPGSMSLPAGICIDYNDVGLFKQYAAPGFEIKYLIVVTNQMHPLADINVYGFGHMRDKEYPTDIKLQDKMREKLKREQEQM
jgi:sugar lactone lactonase YvrE